MSKIKIRYIYLERKIPSLLFHKAFPRATTKHVDIRERNRERERERDPRERERAREERQRKRVRERENICTYTHYK
jgi:hypothetical protein